MSSCSGANIQYKKNPHYWQPGLPKIETVNFPSYLSNNSANEDLKSGTDQWGSQFIPNIKCVLHQREPEVLPLLVRAGLQRHGLVQPDQPAADLAGAARRWPTRSTAPRCRRSVSTATSQPSNQTDIVKPTFSSWYDSSLAAKYGNAYTYNPAKAISILTAAGYKKGSNGIFAKNGHPLSFTIINNGGFSDWVASVKVIQSELKAVGIQITPDNLSNTTFDCRRLRRSLPAGVRLGQRRARPRTTSCARSCTRPTPRRSASRPRATGSGTRARRPTP